MGNGGRQRTNRAVREQIAGGAETLDALNLMQKVARRQVAGSEAHKIATLALDRLDKIANVMRDHVAGQNSNLK